MTNLPIAVLISGGGTTLDNLIQRHEAGDLPVDLKLVICSAPDANGLCFSRHAGIPTHIVRRKDFADPASHSAAVFDLCRQHAASLVVMAGYVEHLLIADDFQTRVTNIHPSLIPAFSGKGFYGQRVHKAALDYGVCVSGCTVHFVDNEFDHGPIIAQRCCPVLPGDSPESLQKRIFEVECELYPAVIAAIARGHVKLMGRRVVIEEIV